MENPYGLVSLWGIVELFRVCGIYEVIRRLELFEDRFQRISETEGMRELSSDEISDLGSTFQWGADELKRAQFYDLSDRCGRHMISLSVKERRNAASIATVLEELRLDIGKELAKRKFVFVQADRTEYACVERLFGDTVFTKFKSARSDVMEAGNCLAIEDGTGAVFHLMRVAEYGLRALAYDRNVAVPKGPLELATWEAIIKELEDAETAIQGYPKTLGRDAQFEFYHGAMMELRRYKNIVRNPVMHTRDEFDRDGALAVMRHVEAFMKILASRISEGSRTPEKWGDDLVSPVP